MLDGCTTNQPFSLPRFALFTIDFLIMFFGGFALFVWLGERPFGIQVASLLPYTCAILLYTFAANRGMPRYLFRCPFVRHQIPRLALQHTGFLIVLFILQTAVIRFRSYLPRSWSLFVTIMTVSVALAFSQVIWNRALLERAHLENELA